MSYFLDIILDPRQKQISKISSLKEFTNCENPCAGSLSIKGEKPWEVNHLGERESWERSLPRTDQRKEEKSSTLFVETFK